MFRSTGFRDFIVGVVFLTSLAVVGIVTLQVTGLSLVGRPTKLQVRFDRISGLRQGDEVRIYGYRIGQVEKIEPLFGREVRPGEPGRPETTDRPILVTINLQHEAPLTRDTRFLIKSAGPLGGNYLEIVPGTGDRQASDAPFEGTATPELFDEIGEMVRENREALREAIEEIRVSVRAINEREGILGALIRDPELRDRISQAVENIESFTRAIREGEGTVGKLINEPKVYNDLEDLIARARRIVTDAEEGKGTLGMLLKDEGLARDVREGVRELQETLAKVNQGVGTAGQLVNNREAWDRLNFVLRQVQELVEDFREQAPINTFVNAVFAAF